MGTKGAAFGPMVDRLSGQPIVMVLMLSITVNECVNHETYDRGYKVKANDDRIPH